MKTHQFGSLFEIRNFLVLHLFAIFCVAAEGYASSCEVVYEIENDFGKKAICQKTEETLSDLNQTYFVLKYECKGKGPVYQYWRSSCDFPKFESVNCGLRPEIFDVCSDTSVSHFLSMMSNENRVLRNNTFDSKFHFTEIVLSRNGIQIIESGAFGCLQGLRSLDLSYNDIESLPVHLFKCMRKLHYLGLHNNRIHTLTQGNFDGLRYLWTLNLNFNLITHLPDRIFRDLTTLGGLFLDSNELESLNPSIFSQLKRLYRLTLRKNKLKSLSLRQEYLFELDIGMNPGLILTNDSFAGMIELELLLMDGCDANLTSAAEGLFLHTPSLRHLSMQHNHLPEISSEIFKPLEHLSHLNLSFNGVTILRDRTFEHNTRLESLDLSGNSLNEIKSGNFKGLSSLKSLNMSHNSLAKVAPDSFDDLRNLEYLNIGNNILLPVHGSHTFQTIFPKLRNLETLVMCNSTSQHFKIRFSKSNRNIKQLDISNNVGLFLKKNSLDNLSKLKYFYMRDCNVTFSDYTVLEQFTYNEMLEDLDLSGNKISKVKKNFFPEVSFEHLRRLDFSRNVIESCSFPLMDRLEFLNLSQNYLLKLPQPLFEDSEMKYLKAIDVSYNRLTDITWSDIRNVDDVWFAHNKIKRISIPEIANTSIRAIHLEENDIHRVILESDLTKPSQTSGMKTGIYLSGNPLDCGCSVFEDYNHLKRNSLQYSAYFADGLMCQQPPELRGRELRDLMPTDFMCQVNESCPEDCRCLYRAYDSATTVDCSRRGLKHLPHFAPYNTSILLVGNNRLSSLDFLNEPRWENLVEVHAEGNLISADQLYVPKNIKILFLNGNRMTTLPETIRRHAEAVKDFQLTLSNNPWPCECSSLSLKTFLLAHGPQIKDVFLVRCTFSNNSISNDILIGMRDQDLCSPKGNI